MYDALLDIAQILRDRLDPAAVREVGCTVVALRQLANRDDAPAEVRRLARPGADVADLSAAIDTAVAHWPALGPAVPDLPPVAPARMKDVLSAANRVTPSRDAIGDSFMALVALLAKSEGRRGGQFYTPDAVARLLAALVVEPGDRVYDPCSGSGGLLLAAHERGAAALVGREINPTTWRLAHWNAVVHDAPFDLGPRPTDSLTAARTGQADAVVANPPFNLARWGRAAPGDPRFPFGPPSSSNANFAWLQHAVTHLAPAGRAAIVLANGSLTTRGRADRHIRQQLLDAGRVHALIALPEQLFWTTVIPATIWVLGPPTSHVQFIDARDLGTRIDRTHQTLADDAIDRIAAWVRQAGVGPPPHEPGRVRSVSLDDIEGPLTPGTQVGDPVPAAATAKLDPLLDEVRRLTSAGRALDDALLRALDPER